jgi:hypothetical protein
MFVRPEEPSPMASKRPPETSQSIHDGQIFSLPNIKKRIANGEW